MQFNSLINTSLKSCKILSFLFFSNMMFSQEISKQDTLFIYEEDAIVNSNMHGYLYYVISIKNDSGINAYNFRIPNNAEMGKPSNLSDLGKKINLDSVVYFGKSKLATYQACQLHNLISDKKYIYLIKNYKTILKSYLLIYEGTQKNMEVIDMGF